MHLLNVTREVRDGTVRLVGMVRRTPDAAPEEIYFAFPEALTDWVPEVGDPFAIALLVPAMLAGTPLRLDAPVSPLLCRSLPEVRDAFVHWFPKLAAVAIEAPYQLARPSAATARAGSFFSGGVDSFYTLLKRKDHQPLPEPLTHVIYMRGIETPLYESRGTEHSLARIMALAPRCGVEVVAGETNVRTFCRAHWERYYFGSGLAATAAALSAGLSAVCIPSSGTYSQTVGSGSTAFTDPMLGTEACRIVHDGAEASRAEKLRKILAWAPDLVRTELRVCMANNGGAFNCGRCYKCVRTLVGLEILGEVERSTAFPDVDRTVWPRYLLADHHDFNVEALELAQVLGARADTIRLLRRVVNRRERQDALIRLVKHSPLARAVPLLQRTRDALGIQAREHPI